MQAQKFYSSKSNAARAAKAMFGDNFKDVADLQEDNGQFAYVAKQVEAPSSKRQQVEALIIGMQTRIQMATTAEEVKAVAVEALKLAQAGTIEKSVAGGIARLHDVRLEELAFAEEAAAQEEDAAIAADVAAAKAQGDEQANAELVQDAAKLADLRLTHADNCPHCGICLDNGYTDFANMMDTQGSFAKAYEVQKHEYACLACGGEWGPAINANRHVSVIDSPCRAVWEIADQFKKAAGGERPRRKDVLEACFAAGIAYYTARTQYQLWLTTQKEMEQRAAQQAKKA